MTIDQLIGVLRLIGGQRGLSEAIDCLAQRARYDTEGRTKTLFVGEDATPWKVDIVDRVAIGGREYVLFQDHSGSNEDLCAACIQMIGGEEVYTFIEENEGDEIFNCFASRMDAGVNYLH